MLSRREFLGCGVAGVSFVSLAGVAPRLLALAAEASAAAEQNDHVLVVIELNGGNDGLNTVIPFEDALYYKNRPTLGIDKENVVKLSEQVGLHPQMGGLGELFQQGRLAVIQGAGYPDPDRSHFRSMEIWHTASTSRTAPHVGWLGHLLDSTVQTPDEQLGGLALTGSLPQACQAEKVVVPVVAQLESLGGTGDEAPAREKLLRKLSTSPGKSAGPVAFMRKQAEAVYRAAERLRDASARYKSDVTYPESDLGNQMQRAAQIISAGLGVRVLFASQGGYDTHSGQAEPHGELLGDLSSSLAAFDRDLKAQKLDAKVVTMVFSEFGRRVDENASQGTDHGAASCMFVLGGAVKGGLFGQYPSLEQLGDGDLIYSTDFRRIYAPLLDRWMGCPSEKLLGNKFEPLDLITA